MGEIPIPLLIVDNSPTSDTKSMILPRNVEAVCYPENLGVPASWNMGIDRGAKWTLIISASMRFGGRFADFIEGASKRASAYGLNPRMAMHLYVIGRAMVDEIGKFDIVFYPSYWDDTDGFRRMIRAGITGCGTSELPYYHPEYVTCIGDAVALRSGILKVDFQRNLDKYKRKWGGEPTQETFDWPYNNPNLSLSFTGEPPEGIA
jgi:hypothetical protein